MSKSKVPGKALLEVSGHKFVAFVMTSDEMFELAGKLIRMADKLEEESNEQRD